ncbi:MAG: DHH family phosphoesterase [Candidatus Diapherotrites archaeon]
MVSKKVMLLSRFKNFCAELSEKDITGVLHHCDADGLAAGLITAKGTEKLTGKRPVLVLPYNYGTKKQLTEIFKKFKQKKVNKLIIVDLNIDQFPTEVKKISKQMNILVIDHHKEYVNLNSPEIVFIKAKYFAKIDPSGYPASKLTFDLFSEITDIKNCDWIACFGILGDMSYSKWKPFFKQTLKRTKLSLKTIDELNELVTANTIISEKNLTPLFKEFMNAKNPREILKSRFQKNVLKIRNEKNKWVNLFEKNAEYYPETGLYFFEIKPKHNIKSAVIDNLTLKYPDKTIIIAETSGSRIKFSARRQDFKVFMNSLLECSVKGIPKANAGGHIPASAGAIPKSAFKKFKKNLLICAKKQKPKNRTPGL